MTLLTTPSRLPGVTFQVESPAPDAALPRMDITAFVGLAAAGPLHTPVPIEDIAQFRDIFGPDLPLAWDEEQGAMQYAHLSTAVFAFFRNGGKRCWVVRVAGEAVGSQFILPGLIRADNWRPAVANARSEGSWADNLRAGTLLQSQALSVLAFSGVGERLEVAVASTSSPLTVGDMVQLSFGSAGLVLYMVADSVTATSTASGQAVSGGQRLGGSGRWFALQAEGWPTAVSAVNMTPDGETALPLRSITLPTEAGEAVEAAFDLALSDMPVVGNVLRVDFDDGQQLLLPVTETAVAAPESTALTPLSVLSSSQGVWPLDDGLTQAQVWLAGDPARLPIGQRLSFDLLVWQGQTLQARLGSVAFSPAHPRAWTRLPSDQSLYRLASGQSFRPPLSGLEKDAAAPRFPLAGPDSAAPLYLPLGMAVQPDPERALLPRPQSAARLERDGLNPFTADLFLDADLGAVSEYNLLQEAHHKLYVRDLPLTGLHTLLHLEEVTLISAPDALHRGWLEQVTPPPAPLPPPTLNPVEPVGADHYRLSWTAVPEATAYLLQEAATPDFAYPSTRYQGAETEELLTQPANCPQQLYYRVRALREGEISPWSNSETILTPPAAFLDCEDTLLGSPALAPPVNVTTPFPGHSLNWTAVSSPNGEPVSYRLQVSAAPDFAEADTIFQGPSLWFTVRKPADGLYFYRLRAEIGAVFGPWSNTRWWVSEAQTRWVVQPSAAYDAADLLTVQRALLRFCAARADILALLSLPLHFRQEEALAHTAALRSGEEKALSFGALYHPWLHHRRQETREGTAVILAPPDGVVCGMMAARALQRGAWIAPANEPLRSVVALQPAFSRGEWVNLFAAQVNLVRQDPRGFMLLSADTLSGDSQLRPINVRRLLILLRRLALREGSAYVFQPNNEAFWRLVRHKFERLLNNLYVRGAFAGATAAEAYQVTADKSINSQNSIDQGRFIMELRIAPAQPLAFLTVRLIQTGQEGLAVQEL